jgi:hypothetical protein
MGKKTHFPFAVVTLKKDYYFGSFFIRGLRPPQTMPTSITTASRRPRAMMPVVSADPGLGIGVGVGVSVGGGVGIRVASSVGGGRREGGGGVQVGPGEGKSAIEVEVSVILSSDGGLAFWAMSSKTSAACARVKVREAPMKKVTATTKNNRMISQRGR